MRRRRLPRSLTLIRDAARTRRGRVGGLLTLSVLALVILGPLVAPYSSTTFVTEPFSAPGGSHLLGGDVLGRDVLSRLLDGGWELIVMALAATVLGVVTGAALGITAAFRGGFIDGFVMRSVDVVLAFPQIVFALLLMSVVGTKVWIIVVAVAIAHAPQVARVMRSAALDVCERDFVRMGELLGLSPWKVMSGDILPNLTSPLMVEAGLRMTYSIIIIAVLSFLGFGLQPPSPNWGSMLNENRIGLVTNPWAVVAPAIVLAILTVGLNMFTDAIARVSLGVDKPDSVPNDEAAQLILAEVVAPDV